MGGTDDGMSNIRWEIQIVRGVKGDWSNTWWGERQYMEKTNGGMSDGKRVKNK
jgi:hypothetical protein